MSEQSSNTSPTASAFYDPDSSCWRTSQGSLLSEEYPLLERLPAWGTTHGGALCAQAIPPCLLRTGGRAGSALLGTPTTATSGRSAEFRRGAAPNPQELAALLPTPRTSDTNGPGVHGDGGLDLRTAAALLPTPTSQAAKHGATPDIHANGYGSNLWDLPHLLPTPRAQNGEPRNMKPWVRPLDQPQNLENALARLLPTPTARDWKDTGDLKKSVPDDDSLLPRAIAHHVTGGRTPGPSSDGNGSSDDQHQPPPIAEGSDPSSSSG